MREIRTSGLMSGERKRTTAYRPCIAPLLDSTHAAMDEASCAPFSKERRMKLAKATKSHRKSGQGLGNMPRDSSAVGAALPGSSIKKPANLQFPLFNIKCFPAPTPSNSQNFNILQHHNSSSLRSAFGTVRTPVVWSVRA
jgi:hypothetical protein